MKRRIYYHDTDAEAVVYYANYLKFFEEARTEFLEERGFSFKKLADMGVLFVVYRQEVDYKAPVLYGQTITVESKVADITDMKIEFVHQVKNEEGRITTKAKTVLVCVGRDLALKQIPAELKQKLSL